MLVVVLGFTFNRLAVICKCAIGHDSMHTICMQLNLTKQIKCNLDVLQYRIKRLFGCR